VLSATRAKTKIMTYKEQLIRGLLALGWKVDDTSASSKYKAFTSPFGEDQRLFVGSNGALRSGRVATQSHSIGDPQHQTSYYIKVLKAGGS